MAAVAHGVAQVDDEVIRAQLKRDADRLIDEKAIPAIKGVANGAIRMGAKSSAAGLQVSATAAGVPSVVPFIPTVMKASAEGSIKALDPQVTALATSVANRSLKPAAHSSIDRSVR